MQSGMDADPEKCVCMLCMYVCIYIHIYMYMYIYIYMYVRVHGGMDVDPGKCVCMGLHLRAHVHAVLAKWPILPHCKMTGLVTWLVDPFGLVSINRLVTR